MLVIHTNDRIGVFRRPRWAACHIRAVPLIGRSGRRSVPVMRAAAHRSPDPAWHWADALAVRLPIITVPACLRRSRPGVRGPGEPRGRTSVQDGSRGAGSLGRVTGIEPGKAGMLTGFAGLSTPLVADACIRRKCRCASRRLASAPSSPGGRSPAVRCRPATTGASMFSWRRWAAPDTATCWSSTTASCSSPPVRRQKSGHGPPDRPRRTGPGPQDPGGSDPAPADDLRGIPGAGRSRTNESLITALEECLA